MKCQIYHSMFPRLDSGNDRRVDKEEFTSEKMKSTLEKVICNTCER